jgi:pimeloyl-ACP methyl ester carboxylesterase
MQFALRHPERTAALALLVPAVYVPRPRGVPPMLTPPGSEFLFDTALQSDILFWAAPRLARQTVIRAILATPPTVVENSSADERERVAQVLDHILPVRPHRLELINDASVTATLTRYEHERIAVPTLILSMADDLFGTFEGAPAIVPSIFHSMLHRLPEWRASVGRTP